MKRMTNAQIDEINMLLKYHGEALTAFYDEAISYGMSLGVKGVAKGSLIAFSVIAGVEIIKIIKNYKQSNEGTA